MVSCAGTGSVPLLPFRFEPIRSHAIEGSLPDHGTDMIGNRLGVISHGFYFSYLLIDPVLGRSGLLWFFQELFLAD